MDGSAIRKKLPQQGKDMGPIVFNHLRRESGNIQRVEDFESRVAFRSSLIRN